jgi:preprotein translocase SecE subunit
MSEEIKAEKKAEKKPNLLKRAGKKIAGFFKGVKGEAKKIVWPSFSFVVKNTGVVILMCMIVGAAIWIFDAVFSLGIRDTILGVSKLS